jgi:hypothetical protein
MNKVYIEVALDNIYSHAIAKVKCYGCEPFTLNIGQASQIITIESGTLGSGYELSSVIDKGKNILQFSCMGLVTQKKFRSGAEDTNLDSYGMQYFPFVSSEIQIDWSTSNSAIDAFSIALPDSFRVIWFRQCVERNGSCAQISHSQGQKESVYVFNWQNSDELSGTVNLSARIPVRLGGREYLSIVSFPLWYYCLSLIGVAILSFQDKQNITFAGVAAAWVLMLRHFTKANAPQMNTVLRDIYLLLGSFLLFWAIFWVLAGFAALFLLLPIVLGAWVYSVVSKEFNIEGILPERLESYLFKERYKAEQKNR